MRDKIPEIIKSQGNTPETETLTPELYAKYLKLKVAEEAKEVSETANHAEEVEEIADLLEVVYALAKNANISPDEIEKARAEKREKRGGFDSKIFLKKVIFSNPEE